MPENHQFHSFVTTLVSNAITVGYRRRSLRRRPADPAAADGGLSPEGAARALLHAAALRGDVSRRRLSLHVRGLDRGPGRGRHHHRMRRRQLLPRRIRCGGTRWPSSSSRRNTAFPTFLPRAAALSPTCPALRPFADWIEQLAVEQVTGGCGGGNYCPLVEQHARADGRVHRQDVQTPVIGGSKVRSIGTLGRYRPCHARLSQSVFVGRLLAGSSVADPIVEALSLPARLFRRC